MALPQAPAGAPDQGPGNASKLVADIHSKLVDLAGLLDGSQVIDDSDKQQLQQVIQGFQGFVEGLGQEPGQQQQGKVNPFGKPVPIGGTVDQMAGGNPGAVPMGATMRG